MNIYIDTMDRWNVMADANNQWDTLDMDDKLELLMEQLDMELQKIRNLDNKKLHINYSCKNCTHLHKGSGDCLLDVGNNCIRRAEDYWQERNELENDKCK